ncbi:MAG: hypothetical protein KUG68_00350 [Flavobacteriaceae bacterium]|nr:hypothetical protein [Flavobacteriaceae bacterium]
MNTQIKMIWDFRGESAQKIAEHHAIHLKEYIALEDINDAFVDTEIVSPMHTIAFLVVDETLMNPLREKLKPHRGQKYLK